jgi:hypothetical protein
MRVKEGDNYFRRVAGWRRKIRPRHNLRADPHIEVRDETIVRSMLVQVNDMAERARLWTLAGATPYAEYQRTKRQIHFL